MFSVRKLCYSLGIKSWFHLMGIAYSILTFGAFLGPLPDRSIFRLSVDPYKLLDDDIGWFTCWLAADDAMLSVLQELALLPCLQYIKCVVMFYVTKLTCWLFGNTRLSDVYTYIQSFRLIVLTL